MIIFFDTETSGLFKSGEEPPRLLQLSYLIYSNDGNLLLSGNNYFSHLGFVVPADVIKIHGLDDEYLMENGVSISDALMLFCALVNVCDLIVCHNVSFDKSVLYEALEQNSIPFLQELNEKKHYCTMIGGRNFTKIPAKNGYKVPKLKELYKHCYGVEMVGDHDAKMDIQNTADCFWHMVNEDYINVFDLIN